MWVHWVIGGIIWLAYPKIHEVSTDGCSHVVCSTSSFFSMWCHYVCGASFFLFFFFWLVCFALVFETGSHFATWAGSKLWDSRDFFAFAPSGAGTSGMDQHHTKLFLVWSESKLKTHQVGPAGWLSSQRAHHTSLIIQFHPQKPHSGRKRETAPLGYPWPPQVNQGRHTHSHTCPHINAHKHYIFQ